jgi:hypothetical protein
MTQTKQVRILARDNDQPANRDVIQFMETNFDTMLSRGLRFKFKIIESEEEVQQLVEQGIKKLPVLIDGDRHFDGSIAIREYLGSTAKSQQAGSSNPEDAFREWQIKEMSKEAMKNDGPDAPDRDMNATLRRAEEEWQARKEMHKQQRERTGHTPAPKDAPKRGDNVQPPQPEKKTTQLELARAAQSGSKDDVLLARMFEQSD